MAAWDLQRRTLTQEDKFDRQPDVRFLGLYHNDQAAEMGAACSLIAGKAMSEYWDGCTAAGPKARESVPFADALPSLDILSVVDGAIKHFGWDWFYVFLVRYFSQC